MFNAAPKNQAVFAFAFRNYEGSSVAYTGLETNGGRRRIGLYDIVVGVDRAD